MKSPSTIQKNIWGDIETLFVISAIAVLSNGAKEQEEEEEEERRKKNEKIIIFFYFFYIIIRRHSVWYIIIQINYNRFITVHNTAIITTTK